MTNEGLAAAVEAVHQGEIGALTTVLDRHPEALNGQADHGMTLLHFAAERDHVPMVRLLLDRGADQEIESSWGQTPFEWAANSNAQDAAGLLRSRGAQRFDVWLASALGSVEEVEAYFDGDRLREGAGRKPGQGADLYHWPEDCAFRAGDPLSDAFYIACRNGHLEVAKLLLERGADIGAKGYFGATALHWAAGKGHSDVVEWLLAEGADPTARDPNFEGTAAGWAREFGHDALARRIEAFAQDEGAS